MNSKEKLYRTLYLALLEFRAEAKFLMIKKHLKFQI